MSKSFTMNQINNIDTIPILVRHVSIMMPCKICKKSTQEDPFSKYFFGVCCSECSSHINRYSKTWIKKHNLEENESSRKLFFDTLNHHLEFSL